MGYDELTETLRREGEESRGRIRNEAEGEMAAIRAAWTAEREVMEQDAARAISRECAALTALESAGTRRRVQALLLEAENRMAARLLASALALLPRLRETGYAEALGAIIRALPPAGWRSARVNPADLEQTRSLLPGVEVLPDPSITGGIEVETADDRLRVSDTLEKRLERYWPELVPELMGKLRGVVDDAGRP